MGTNGKYPRLRPVEVFPTDYQGQQMIVVQDPARLAVSPIMVSPAALLIFSYLDGLHSPEEICRQFAIHSGQQLRLEHLEDLIQQLDEARFLDSETFASYYETLVAAFRAAPARVSQDFQDTNNGELQAMLAETLDGGRFQKRREDRRRLVGLIAPHLDYIRGQVCYADAYGLLASVGKADRYVILGTNHFGRSPGVVATSKDFATPLGTTHADRDFLARLEDRCGGSLREHEYDHAREHSIDLQVILLQYLFGAEQFDIVPVLCQDPCGPTGHDPSTGQGVNQEKFSDILGQLIVEDTDHSTVLIAGADLSHIGQRFGDDRELDKEFLAAVESSDRRALDRILAGDPAGFVQIVAAEDNPTRICSAGCIYAINRALPDTQRELLSYHQTIDRSSGTGVTCAAIALWQEPR